MSAALVAEVSGTLLFPSLGTGDNHISLEVASSALLASLTKYPKLQTHVTLCDNANSIQKASNVFGLNLLEIQHHMDLDQVLKSRPTVLAVECNWRFSRNANVLSRALHSLSNSEEISAQKSGELSGCQTGAMVEGCFPLSVNLDHILYSKYGVEWVIYVRPPNMNPSRPDCIGGVDADQRAHESLERTYDCLFTTFERISSGSLLKQEQSQSPPECGDVSDLEFGEYKHPGKAIQHAGSWHRALYQILESSSTQSPQVFHSNSDCVVIYDGFPKACVHLLALPRSSCFGGYITRPSQLSTTHLSSLKKISQLAKKIIIHFLENTGLPLRAGFHTIPSMEPLHVHIISQDFNSPCLKNKKHFNSFMTPFFVDIDEVISNIQSGLPALGHTPASESSFGEALRCRTPLCGCLKAFSNIPTLKQHLSELCEEVTHQHKKLRTSTDNV